MTVQLAPLLESFRTAAWLTPRRARAYAVILLAAGLAICAAWIALSWRGLDPSGKPIGTDFLSFWAASKLALAGSPEQVYSTAAHYQVQREAFGGAIEYTAFFYPPVFLLICLPLAALPYFISLAAWLGVTGYAYWRVVRGFFADPGGMWLAFLAFPAVLVNAGHGQNGFLAAALFGGGVLASGKRPILAGFLFGCLVFKPHLAIVLPIALAARGAWKTFCMTGATALGLIALSAAIFGMETWTGFLAVSPLARQALEGDLVGAEKMQSAFAAMRLLGASVSAAYSVQAIAALTVCAGLVALARSGAKTLTQGVAAVSAALLATPFLLDYDLTLLAIPLAWLFSAGLRSGFLPWEKVLLLAGFVLPLVSRISADIFGVPLGPPVLAGIYGLVLRRGFAESLPQPSRNLRLLSELPAWLNPLRSRADADRPQAESWEAKG